MAILEVINVRKNYGEQIVIRNIDMHLGEGELVCLLGVSGVGKTTLFHVISGLYTPDEGKVFLHDKDISGQPGQISYMLQKDLLLPYKTILKNVSLPLILRGENKDSAEKKALKLLPDFGLEGTESKYPHQLSGGMRQRAALLRTYFASHGVVLLDEPFSALDTITKASMHSWFLDLKERIKLSAIFITHDIDEAILLADRIYILSGKPGEITNEIKINEARPRSLDFSYSEDFLSYKRRIRDALQL